MEKDYSIDENLYNTLCAAVEKWFERNNTFVSLRKMELANGVDMYSSYVVIGGKKYKADFGVSICTDTNLERNRFSFIITLTFFDVISDVLDFETISKIYSFLSWYNNKCHNVCLKYYVKTINVSQTLYFYKGFVPVESEISRILDEFYFDEYIAELTEVIASGEFRIPDPKPIKQIKCADDNSSYFPDYSIKHLVVSGDREWTREMLWSYDRVEKITIDGDWVYNDDDCSNFCSYLHNLKEFEVINSKGTFFIEDGALYAYIKSGEFWGSNTRFCYLPSDVEGKVLVAVPTQYGGSNFNVAEGTVAICPGVFEGMNKIESIVFPNSIEYLDFCCLSMMENLKTLYIPNKKVCILDQHELSPNMPELCCTDAFESISEDVQASWLHPWYYAPAFAYDSFVSGSEEKHPLLQDEDVKAIIMEAISSKENFYQFCKEYKNRNDKVLPLLLQTVKPRIIRPDTKEEAEMMIELLWGSREDAFANGLDSPFKDNEVDLKNGDPEEIARKWGEHCGWEDDLEYIQDIRADVALRQLVYIDPLAFMNAQNYKTLHCLLRERADVLLQNLTLR